MTQSAGLKCPISYYYLHHTHTHYTDTRRRASPLSLVRVIVSQVGLNGGNAGVPAKKPKTRIAIRLVGRRSPALEGGELGGQRL